MKKIFLLVLAVFLLNSRSVIADDEGMGRPPASDEMKDMNPGSMHGPGIPNQPKTESVKPKPVEPTKQEPTQSGHDSDEGYGRPAHEDVARDQNDPSYHVVLSNMLGENLPAQPSAEPPKPAIAPAARDGQAMRASFSEISGLDTEQEPIDYRTGDEDTVTRKISGIRKNPTINQKRSAVDGQNDFGAFDALQKSTGQAPNTRNMGDLKEEVASAEMHGRDTGER